MPSDMQIDLSKTRLQIARERLAFAEEILKLGDYKTVANRSYYAVFAAMRAVLALQGFDSKKHSGIIAEFRREYIKSGLLPKELSPIIEALVEIRQGSDYDDFYLISKEEVEEQLHNAQQDRRSPICLPSILNPHNARRRLILWIRRRFFMVGRFLSRKSDRYAHPADALYRNRVLPSAQQIVCGYLE